jgi:hypothetical protein
MTITASWMPVQEMVQTVAARRAAWMPCRAESSAYLVISVA